MQFTFWNSLFQALVDGQTVFWLSLTLLVPVFDIGPTGDEHRHELLVPSRARQGQRSVVIAFSLHAQERNRSRYSETKNKDNFFFFFPKPIPSQLSWITHMCIDVHGWVHGEHGLRGHTAACLRAGLGRRGLGRVRGAGGATGHSAIHS